MQLRKVLKKLFISPLTLCWVFAHAQPTSKTVNTNPDVVCHEELARLCPNKSDFNTHLSCLRQHESEISDLCKEDIQRRAQAQKQIASRGGGSLSGFGGMSFTPTTVPLAVYTGRVIPQNSSPALTENYLNVSTPLFVSPTDISSLSVTAGALHFDKSIPLDTQVQIPQDLYRTEVGVQYQHQMTGKKSWGLRGSVGFVGDKVFENSRDISFSVIGNYIFPKSENSSWGLTVFFSNNSALLSYIPIPGFVYIYKAETFTGLFGLPFAAIQWNPTFPWLVSASIFGPTLSAEAAYGSIDHFQIFSGFGWIRQRYMLSDRTQERDRLTVEEKKIMVGFRSPLFRAMISEFQVGNSFDRLLYIGNGLTNRDGGLASLDASVYLSWALKVTF